MPLQTRNGTTYGPVALICATVCFLAAGLMVLYLITRYPEQAEVYIRPLVPSLITLGAALVLWFRTKKGSEENAHISRQVADNTQRMEHRLNGDLDKRIEEAVTKAIEAFARKD